MARQARSPNDSPRCSTDVAIAPNREGWYPLASLGLELGVDGEWLRLREPSGRKFETSDE